MERLSEKKKACKAEYHQQRTVLSNWNEKAFNLYYYSITNLPTKEEQ